MLESLKLVIILLEETCASLAHLQACRLLTLVRWMKAWLACLPDAELLNLWLTERKRPGRSCWDMLSIECLPITGFLDTIGGTGERLNG